MSDAYEMRISELEDACCAAEEENRRLRECVELSNIRHIITENEVLKKCVKWYAEKMCVSNDAENEMDIDGGDFNGLPGDKARQCLRELAESN